MDMMDKNQGLVRFVLLEAGSGIRLYFLVNAGRQPLNMKSFVEFLQLRYSWALILSYYPNTIILQEL